MKRLLINTLKFSWRTSKVHTILFFIWTTLLCLSVWTDDYYSALIDGLLAITSINELRWISLEEELKELKK